MKNLWILCLSIILRSQITAQPVNLVLNPGFEDVTPYNTFETCEYNKSGERFTQSVAHWTCFRDLTADYIIWGDNCRYPEPHGGDKMVGLITYHPYLDTGWETDYHEYIQGELSNPLKPGTKYLVEFYIHQNDSIAEHHLIGVYGRNQEVIPTASGNIGVYFSPTSFSPKENIRKTVAYGLLTPQVNHQDPVITKHGEWKCIQMTFTADKPYRYFIIGNFKKDETTITTLADPESIDRYNLSQNKFWKKKKRVAYYCIDDISITAIINSSDHPVEFSSSSFKDDTYTFQHVKFRPGEKELLPESLPELNALAEYLKGHPGLKVEIEGHTDSIGDEESNLLLSEGRAAAVRQYLEQLGISPERLFCVGQGETSPVATNATMEGRRKNRRVACKILEED